MPDVRVARDERTQRVVGSRDSAEDVAACAMWNGEEPVSAVRVVLLLGIVGCIVGLKLTH